MSGTDILLLKLVFVAVAVSSAIWVYRDAEHLDNPHSTSWAVFTMLLWMPVFLFYLVVRRNFRPWEHN